jgi:hypothetical protein
MKLTTAQLLAAQACQHAEKAQRLAAEVHGLAREILASARTAEVAGLAQAAHPKLPALAAMERLRDQLAPIAVLVAALPVEFKNAAKVKQPAIEAGDARCREIQAQISELDRQLNSDVYAVLQPARLWDSYADKGLSRDQILAAGIPEPEIRSEEMAKPIYARLHAAHAEAVSKLIAERSAIRRWQSILSGEVPEAVHEHWTPPKGLNQAMEGLL